MIEGIDFNTRTFECSTETDIDNANEGWCHTTFDMRAAHKSAWFCESVIVQFLQKGTNDLFRHKSGNVLSR